MRITAPPREETAGRTATGAIGTDPAGLYIRSLIRSQLRLGIVCAVAFVVVLVAVPVVFTLVPGLDAAAVGPVPVSWIVLGAGLFPVIIAVAALYVHTASRNESRYRSLADDS
ncbi:MAG: hypothetical protein EAS51_13340 [Microbacteriaceae bacterium]|nr:MAG: hypothetical protein EAS51_13340 [Microbacteriaceae bacterium]